MLLKLADALTVKTEYIEKLPGTASKVLEWTPKQVKAVATSSLHQLLAAEAELSYSTAAARPFADVTDHALVRLGLKGSWSDLSYGAEHRFVGADFVNVSGPPMAADHEGGEVWALQKFGIVSIKASLSDFTNNTAQNHDTPRINRLQAGTTLTVGAPSWPTWSLFYSRGSLETSKEPAGSQRETGSVETAGTSLYLKRPAWETTLASTFSQGMVANRPIFADGSLHFAPSGIRSDTALVSLDFKYRPGILPVQMSTFGAYSKTKSSQSDKNTDALNLSTSLVWHSSQAPARKNTFSLGTTYHHQLDRMVPNSSSENLSVWIRFETVF